jgi:Lrp/AsnC family transcriptional regulator for asnA, asnC and gidA
MDDLDLQIIKYLEEDGRISYNKLAKKLNTPSSTIHFRIKKLIEEKIIVRFSSIINIGKLGYETVGWVGITIDSLKTDEVSGILASFEEVRIVVATGGAHNIVVQILAKNERELWNFIRENIQTIEGVKDIDVTSALKVFKWKPNYFFKIP